MSGNLLENANLTRFYSIFLLFQAGYLTIKKVFEDDTFLLGFPNQEVRNAFSSYLLAEYVQKDWSHTDALSIVQFVSALVWNSGSLNHLTNLSHFLTLGPTIYIVPTSLGIPTN